MKIRALSLALLLVGGTSYGQTLVDVSNLPRGQYILTVGDSVTVSSTPITIVRPGVVVPIPTPPVFPPTPTPTPTPPVSFVTAVRGYTVAVADYPAKEDHCRQVAFVFGYIAPMMANVKNVADARNAAKQFFNQAVGADAPQWSEWWSRIDKKLDSMSLTPATFSTALKDIATGLTADLPPAAPSYSTVFGRDTYGLDPTKIQEILAWLLPLIFQLIQLFQ